MNPGELENQSSMSMLELFRAEAETQTSILTSGLLELERGAAPAEFFEPLMRAAHSLKGAARIVNQAMAVRVAHALEDCFVAAQKGLLALGHAEIDLLLRGVDLLSTLARKAEQASNEHETNSAAEVDAFLQALATVTRAPLPATNEPGHLTGSSTGELAPGKEVSGAALELPVRKPDYSERTLRLAAENLNRLLGLAGESLVESRWLRPFGESFHALKREQLELAQKLEELRSRLSDEGASTQTKGALNELSRHSAQCQQYLNERMQELELFDRRSSHLAQRLYLEVLRTRMRPFSDGVRRFPRMVRDLARALGKSVKLDIVGESTQVDRDILERLETPLAHLLRNAVDHGCESAAVRQKAGKPLECTLRLEARHSAGVLLVTVSDDGAGVDLGQVRTALVEKRLLSAAVAERMTEAELLGSLFLPGFTLKKSVTEISGRGFGLDVVQNMVKGVRGAIRLNNQPGRGLRVQLQLPLTLSVLRALLVEVAGEPYAIPLNQITRTVKLPRTGIQILEGLPHFHLGDQQIGLLTAHQVFDCGRLAPGATELCVVVLGDRKSRYGLVVDRFLGERELVVQPLDPRLGAVRDVSAAALMEDGAPVLIVDVEGLIRSITRLLGEGRLEGLEPAAGAALGRGPKRVLAVDDSLTVRELERKLLTSRGYLADVAVDGAEAWKAVQSGVYSLVITDVDMPRLDGIQLASLIKKDPRLHTLPVLILSYKELEAERLRGLEAGADYYLTKGGFEDEALLQAVVDLIGEPDP